MNVGYFWKTWKSQLPGTVYTIKGKEEESIPNMYSKKLLVALITYILDVIDRNILVSNKEQYID